MIPYLPDILKDVITRVNTVFSTRDEDPFNIYFDYGLQNDVTKNIYKKETGETGTFPLTWLVMNFVETKGKSLSIEADVSCDLIIGMPSEPDISMQQRVDNNFKPFLLPIYDEIIYQISQEKKLANSVKAKISHSKIDLPYWGGGDVGGTNTKNLWKNYIDAILIKDLKLSIKKYKPTC